MDVRQSSVEALRRITRALDVHSRSLLQQHNLTGPQLSVLKELARQGQSPIGTLAKSTHLGAPTVTGIVDRLERQGWVSRAPGKEDRRQVFIVISEAGKQVLERSPPQLMETFCQKLHGCPQSEQRQISETLQKVAGMIEQSAQNGAHLRDRHDPAAARMSIDPSQLTYQRDSTTAKRTKPTE